MKKYRIVIGGVIRTEVRAVNQLFACIIAVNNYNTRFSPDTKLEISLLGSGSKHSKVSTYLFGEIEGVKLNSKPEKKVVENIAHQNYPHYSQDPIGSQGRLRYEEKKNSFIEGFNTCMVYYNIK